MGAPHTSPWKHICCPVWFSLGQLVSEYLLLFYRVNGGHDPIIWLLNSVIKILKN